MRVIAGTAKGRKLGAVPQGTRPMTDRAREGLFSSLADVVPGAEVLDLFSGTGAVGIEALSRGAQHVTFVEQAPAAIKALVQNLRTTGFQERATVRRHEVLDHLRGPRHPVNLVFIDAPYAMAPRACDEVLAALADGWLSSQGAPGTVMLSRAPKGYIPVIPLGWALAKRLEYGDTHLYLYREA